MMCTLQNSQSTHGVLTHTFHASNTPAIRERPNKIRGKQWNDIMFDTSVDMLEEDLNFFETNSNHEDLQEHLSYMRSDRKKEMLKLA